MERRRRLTDPDRVEPHDRALREAARAVDSWAFTEGPGRTQELSRRIVEGFLANFDILVTPTMACLPPLIGEWRAGTEDDPLRAVRNTYPWPCSPPSAPAQSAEERGAAATAADDRRHGAHPGVRDRPAYRDRRVERELSARDEQFLAWWDAHDVAVRDTGTKHLRHPVAGDLHLDWNAVTWAADPDLQIIVWTAEAGTPTHDSLRLLASWATDRPPPQPDRLPHACARSGRPPVQVFTGHHPHGAFEPRHTTPNE
ncbi:hypothetical protein [Streptomyces roseirectus]|uniref:MmyB family transcriptional regulator n=1 Tax=Streptomyces roseirectus TaxID=2768066 RepID=UPI001FE9A01D|nr:hypothetical protein [Streptomyces roseirectus]